MFKNVPFFSPPPPPHFKKFQNKNLCICDIFFLDFLMTGEVIDVAQIWIIKILKRKQTQMDFGLVPTLNTTLKEKK